MNGVDNKVVIGSLFGLGLAALGGAALYRHFHHEKQLKDSKQNTHINQLHSNQLKTIALLGDVGGTNIRLRLIELSGASYEDTKTLK